MATGIEWTDHTWNPILGCARCSDGCRFCYAEQASAMLVRTRAGNTPYAGVVRSVGGEWRWTNIVRRNTDQKFYELRRLRPRTPPRKIFCNSMSDIFHEQAVANGLTYDCYYEMRMASGNIYQVLTKRAEIAATFYAAHPEVWNLPGLWLGVSVEDARVRDRIDVLRDIPVVLRFLSIEPLIGPIGALDLSGIGWVIVGGESGKHRRPMHPDWVREVRDQCVTASIPFFFKQWGGPRGAKGGHEKAVIDGREWKEFPP